MTTRPMNPAPPVTATHRPRQKSVEESLPICKTSRGSAVHGSAIYGFDRVREAGCGRGPPSARLALQRTGHSCTDSWSREQTFDPRPALPCPALPCPRSASILIACRVDYQRLTALESTASDPHFSTRGQRGHSHIKSEFLTNDECHNTNSSSRLRTACCQTRLPKGHRPVADHARGVHPDTSASRTVRPDARLIGQCLPWALSAPNA
jgi:hypothetical protein